MDSCSKNGESQLLPSQYSESDTELLDKLTELGDEIGRTPVASDLRGKEMPSASVFANRFGSWNKALIAAGFEPNMAFPGPDGETGREYYERIRSWASCSNCDEDRDACIHFHHLPNFEKEFSLGSTAHGRYSAERAYNEVEKCVPLCANCHALHHSNNYAFDATSLDIPNWPEPNHYSVG